MKLKIYEFSWESNPEELSSSYLLHAIIIASSPERATLFLKKYAPSTEGKKLRWSELGTPVRGLTSGMLYYFH